MTSPPLPTDRPLSLADCGTQVEESDFYLDHERAGDLLARLGLESRAAAAYGRALALNPQADWILAKSRALGRPAPQAGATQALFLFLPYYTPKEDQRAAELRHCLQRNLETGLFARIVLLQDDDSPLPFSDSRLSVIRLAQRPTYRDWVEASRRLCPGRISLLANSDIHFDGSVALLREIFAADPQAFVALSRFDRQGDALVPHPNPHWSQDTWAFRPDAGDDRMHDAMLDVPLGVPRCDNKIAYVFAVRGYKVYNPFPFVRSVHVHETNLRYYDKKGDRRLIGGMAMVHPGPALTAPARLDLEIWAMQTGQVGSVKVNNTLQRWAEEARIAALPRPAILAHDADWQHPAITEQHAFARMQAILPAEPGLYDTVYLAFPFATLVDLLAHVGPRDTRTRALQERLDALKAQLAPYARVVTVAQHIRVRQFARLFAQAGVTDLFWSHRVTGETAFPDAPGVRLHPFPLYPVQQVPRGAEDVDRARPVLFSFVGVRSLKNYLTRSRDMIIDLLGRDPRGHVADRDAWHYQKTVYEAQVLARADAALPDLVNDGHSEDFRQVMDRSVFSLCPSGSGPNSIRLWEAMLNGSIPVILADTWAPPGADDPAVAALWARATLRVPETAAAIAALPMQLEAIAADRVLLRQKRLALADLARRYGPEGFVPDVAAMFETSRSTGQG